MPSTRLFEVLLAAKQFTELSDNLLAVLKSNDIVGGGITLDELPETLWIRLIETDGSLWIRQQVSKRSVVDTNRCFGPVNWDVIERTDQIDETTRSIAIKRQKALDRRFSARHNDALKLKLANLASFTSDLKLDLPTSSRRPLHDVLLPFEVSVTR